MPWAIAMSVSKDRGVFRLFQARQTAAPPRQRPPAQPHRVLRVSRHETDAVQIILAAQIQLRRWRRGEPGHASFKCVQRIREIVAARDSLVAQAVTRHRILTHRDEHSSVVPDSPVTQHDERGSSLARTV